MGYYLRGSFVLWFRPYSVALIPLANVSYRAIVSFTRGDGVNIAVSDIACCPSVE